MGGISLTFNPLNGLLCFLCNIKQLNFRVILTVKIHRKKKKKQAPKGHCGNKKVARHLSVDQGFHKVESLPIVKPLVTFCFGLVTRDALTGQPVLKNG